MQQVGLSANLMSLGGLAISLGMIVDAAIVQVENVERHLGEQTTGRALSVTDRLPVVLRAVLEVRRPSLFGELIIALTFVPLLTLQGMEGKMFIPLALTVVIALLSSLVLSMTVVPVLAAVLMKPRVAEEGGHLLERGDGSIASCWRGPSTKLVWSSLRRPVYLSAERPWSRSSVGNSSRSWTKARSS